MVDDEAIDNGILAALVPAALDLENRIEGGVDGEPLMMWAVVVFAYLDNEGNSMRAYRRVNADWFDVGGAVMMLGAAHGEAWRMEPDE